MNIKLLEKAIEECSWESFEKFSQVFASCIGHGKYVALGGMHDGGADSYFESVDARDSFAQISKQEATVSKIKSTIDTLRKNDRTVKKLTYFTSRIVPKSDKIRSKIFDEKNVLVEIRDRVYLAQNTNDYNSVVQAAKDYLLPSLEYLKDLHNNELVPRNILQNHRELAVYLTQELERRKDNSTLPESVCDSLILWALEGTDPDNDMLMSKSEILSKIHHALPTAKSMITSRIDHRLKILSSKNNGTHREINSHNGGKGYCLPFNTREQIINENVQDHQMIMEASTSFMTRVVSEDNNISSEQKDEIVKLCHLALHKMFEKQGLELACFTSDINHDAFTPSTVSDCINDVLNENDSNAIANEIIAIKVLRGVFYHSQSVERDYLTRLSRTYTILFALQADPKIAEYFDKMSKQLVLYIGSDIIIRCLSEYYLNDEDKSITNLLAILKASGAKLILTEKTLEEVWFHMKLDLNKFERDYQESEKYFDIETAKSFPRILMRSYMYNKLKPMKESRKNLKSFSNYLNSFVDIDDLRTGTPSDSLQSFLMLKYNMVYEDAQEMENGIPTHEIDELSKKILHQKSNHYSNVLAINDALQILRVYKRRKDKNDNSPANPFGYNIWWLTEETAVIKAAKKEINDNNSRFLMRPEFLLTYLSYVPELKNIRSNFSSFFPSKLGVRLSYRAKKDIFDQTVKEALRIQNTDEARAQYTIRKLANSLKGATDNYNKFEPVR